MEIQRVRREATLSKCASLGAALGLAMFMGAAWPAPALAAPVREAAIDATEGLALPRHATEAEKRLMAVNPIRAERGAGEAPTGPVFCPPEYAPMDGILIAWRGPTAWLNILRDMAVQITTVGDARVYLVVPSSFEQNSAMAAISAAGADMSRVIPIIRFTDAIWIRDYGPRYIYEGDCRAVVDHTYNLPRPNDNAQPIHFAQVRGHQYYSLPLVHGGGNFHLDGLDRGRATRLINLENPGLTEPQILGLWQSYQNLNVTLYQPFPLSVDGTRHIDMWMQVISDNEVVISDWPNNVGSTQDIICDGAAVSMAAEGFTVYRTPARNVSGVHYTYTNVVICNDLVMVPGYTNGLITPFNGPALATWQAAMPGKTVIQLPCEGIVAAAGVIHCIVMHVPEHRGGENPTAYLKNLNGGEVLTPGSQQEIRWISDDDNAVTAVFLRLSTDGGQTYPTQIAAFQSGLGTYSWTVPNVNTSFARVRVIAFDAEGRSGEDDSDANFTIGSGCPADLDGDGQVGAGDLAILLGSWGVGGGNGPADIDGDGQVNSNDLAQMLGGWGVCA